MERQNVKELHKVVEKYFHKDDCHEAIRCMLRKKLNVTISLRTLSRILSKHGLRRKNIIQSPVEHIVIAMAIELQGSGRNLGYKSLWQRLRKIYRLQVKQKTVLGLLREMDPDGVEARLRYRLRRREYHAEGPNALWHADNHDKLKRFGFAMYGIIDGYSRKVLSLEAATTNNRPEVITSYYAKTVTKMRCVPALLRTDKGTEATIMGNMQMALRSYHDDDLAGERSYIRGKSTRNQRIESYWRQFRQQLGQFYMDFFKGMEAEGLLDIGNRVHIECLRYCFGNLLMEEINITRRTWNEHTIRKQDRGNVLTGKPNELYHCPERFGGVDCQKTLEIDHLRALLAYTEESQLINPQISNFVEEILPGRGTPAIAQEAFELYQDILEEINILDQM